MPTEHAKNARAIVDFVTERQGDYGPQQIDAFGTYALTHAMLEVAAQIERLADRRSHAAPDHDEAFENIIRHGP